MKRTLLLFAIVLLITNNSFYAQTKAEVLTNKSVIELYKAGLGNETVISKISSSNCKFDLTTTGLIALKKQGLPNDIINVMVNKTDSKTASATVAKSPGILRNTEKKNINIELINYIHTYYNDTIKPLEKSLAASESKRKMMGYGGSLLLLEIEGTTSPVKLSQTNAEDFIVNTGGNNPPDFVLYKLKVAKGKRQAVVGKLTISGPKSGENLISVEITKGNDGLYYLKPGQKLDKGEYFFANKPNLNTSTSSIDVYAFCII
ncbi:MAG: hypothetical protein WKG06_15220 [Segetibacter sp.]